MTRGDSYITDQIDYKGLSKLKIFSIFFAVWIW